MRIPFCATFAAFCLLLGGCQPPAPSVHDDMAIVRSYCDRDLMQAKEEEVKPLQDALARLCPGQSRENDELLGRVPRHVWRFGRIDEPSCVLVLEGNYIDRIPGTTHVRLTLLTAAGEDRTTVKFTTGHRCWLETAGLQFVPGIEFPVIVLEIPNGLRDHCRQYIALIDDRFDSIRFEDDGGRATGHCCDLGRSEPGPAVIQQSAEQWETDLYAVDRARVLRALVWLSAWHRDESAPLATKVKSRPAVAMRLCELAERGPAWEREMAALALRPD